MKAEEVLCSLVDVTKVPNEDDEVYLSKLALSTGRCTSKTLPQYMQLMCPFLAIVRPKTETERTLQDRHPTRELVHLGDFLSVLTTMQLCSRI